MGDVQVPGRVETHAVGLVVDLSLRWVLGRQLGKQAAIGNFARLVHVVHQDSVLLALGQVELLAVGRKDDAVGKRQPLVDQAG
jgi:hypothetical protein